MSANMTLHRCSLGLIVKRALANQTTGQRYGRPVRCTFMFLLTALALALPGCRGKTHRELVAANERIEVLNDRISELEKDRTRVEEERDRAKDKLEAVITGDIATIRKEYEDQLDRLRAEKTEEVNRVKKHNEHRIAQIRQDHQKRMDDMNASMTDIIENHRSKASQLEGHIASLRLELGAVQRENIAMRQILDAGPRIDGAKANRLAVGLAVLAVMFLLTLLALGYTAMKYRGTRDRLNLCVMKEVSALRKIGVQP